MTRHPKKGDRVAHRELDDEEGAAKSGVVSDVVGDKKQRMVILEGSEAYDERELVRLGSARLSSGPVIIRPRHLRVILRRSQAIISLLLVLVLSATLIWFTVSFGWSAKTALLASGGFLALALAGLIVLDRDYRRERNPGGG